jgi:enamidase
MALERMPLVFKAGKGYRTDVLIDAMKGSVGLY